MIGDIGRLSNGNMCIPELIVVGESEVQGDTWPGIRIDPESLPHIYAPGYNRRRKPRDGMEFSRWRTWKATREAGKASAATAIVPCLAE